MDLSSRYLGLNLRSPLVASSSPRTSSVEGVRQLAGAGVAAVVLPSLFEEELRRQAAQDAAAREAGTDSFPEALSYFPDVALSVSEPNASQYLSLVERSAAVGIPIIASLNGVTAGGWAHYASALERAGAAAIELNIYHLPEDPLISGRDVEEQYIETLASVKAVARIPVAVKLSPYFSSLGEMAVRLDQAGADGLVLFNRFLHPDVNPETLTVSSGFGLSSPAEGRLPRIWIAHLAGRIRASLAGSTGVEDASDVAAYLLAGADVVMTTSSLLRHGPDHARVLLGGLTAWMARQGFSSLDDFRGKLVSSAGQAGAAGDRAGYVRSLRAADRGERSW